jgi:hypothetical protein
MDPFWGTGTTSLAALVAGRNSVGYELEPDFTQVFEERVADLPNLSRDVIQQRLQDHEAFVAERENEGKSLSYQAENYDFPVTTKQERNLQFYAVDRIDAVEDGYRATYRPYDDSDSK